MSTKNNNGKGAQGATAHENNGTDSIPAQEQTVVSPIEERIRFFEGLAALVNVKRRFEVHKAMIEELVFPDEELVKFESDKNYGIRITIHDNENDEYVINNPRLVGEVQEFLRAKLTARIAEYDQQIVAYGK